jgi:hypothetical protein
MHACRLNSFIGLIAAVLFAAIPARVVRAEAPNPTHNARTTSHSAPANQSKSHGALPTRADPPSVREAVYREPRHAPRHARMTWRQREQLRQFKIAAARFPAFCEKWGRLLQERHVNDASHIKWTFKDGWETGTYTGYSKIKTCTCEQSEGFAIGKLSYDELTYYVVGKTKEEAQHAKPRVTAITTTTEIFRWEHGRWFSF